MKLSLDRSGAGLYPAADSKSASQPARHTSILALLCWVACSIPAFSQSDLVKVVSRPVERSVKLPGDLAPYQSVDIYARVIGYVETISVDRGSSVRKGQIIAELSAPELQAQLAETQSRVEIIDAQRAEAEAKLASAQSTYDRMKSASATAGAVAGNELVVAEKAVAAAKSVVAGLESSRRSALASVETIRESVKYLKVVAPFDGIVTERDAHPGALVGPGRERLVRIEQVSRLRLIVAVPEADAGGIALRSSVVFSVPAYPGQTFRGTIARVPRSLDQKTRTMAVEADVTNAGGKLAPGMYAEVMWPVRQAGPSLLVPPTAIATTTERTFVIRAAADGRAEWVNVRRGRPAGDLIEVISPDLAEGDSILRRATDEIREGTRLK
jgi:membrane fusion protein, multidrug efflux system